MRPFSSATMYDESIDVTGAEEVKSPTFNSNKDRDVYSHDKAGPSNDVAILEIQQRPGSSHVSTHRHMTHQTSDQSDNSDDDDDDDDNDDDDDVDVQAAALEGTYDPNEFSHLPVSPEVKDLFQNITRYTPQNIELDYKLRPFIPDFIPAVGDIDAFLKIPRPDGKSDSIGLKVLDEPCAKQSEPAVLHLQLRAVAKQSSAKAVSPLCILCYFKMNDVIDNPADCEVRSVIRFLNARHLKPAEIYRQLKEVYGDTVMNERNVRKWCEMFNNGRTNVHDETRPGRPSLITEDLKIKVNDRILQDRRTSLDELHIAFPDISRSLLGEIVSQHLGYHKICAR
ncbi:hypothetical protein ANN_18681 [Periplaneta americana]|uniref:Intraflagellar transport protein 46 homolog n=1 Tax=Periplaneta americana TaxID=6978 RepID=A0ABQ8SQH6_PERAM|nr:hypothetical protein ANN_18681 [Periplaneta americana]